MEQSMYSSNSFLFDEELSIYYEVAGEGSLPVVLLHGFGASHESWYDLMPFLLEKSVELDAQFFLMDLMGFGHSAKPKNAAYSISQQAQIVQNFIDSHFSVKVVIGGHSYGGAVALLTSLGYMKQESDRLAGLVLIDAAAFPARLPFFIRLLRGAISGPLIMSLAPARLRAKLTLKHLLFNDGHVTRERVSRYAKYFVSPGAAGSFVRAARNIIPSDGEEHRVVKHCSGSSSIHLSLHFQKRGATWKITQGRG